MKDLKLDTYIKQVLKIKPENLRVDYNLKFNFLYSYAAFFEC